MRRVVSRLGVGAALPALALCTFLLLPGTALPAIGGISATLVDAKVHTEVVPGSPQLAPPGSVVSIAVKATLTSGDQWRSTSWAIGSGPETCVNTADHSGSGTFTEYTGNVTLPEVTGSGTIRVKLFGDSNACTGSASSASSSFAISTPSPNATLARACDPRVALVLDESYSIYQTSGAMAAVRSGALAFANGLIDTGAQIAVVEFNSQARTVPLSGNVYNTITPAFTGGAFTNYVNALGPGETYSPGSYSSPNYYTNWQDAFTKVAALPQRPDLVVFLTDGDPTARSTGATTFETGFPNGSYAALQPAFVGANALKSAGAHVLVMGVGAAVGTPDSAVRLRAISGPRPFPPNAIFDADYSLITNFQQLQAALAELGRQVCSVGVSVKKLVDDDGNGTYAPANGWNFSGTVSVAPGSADSFRWLLPGDEAGPPSGGSTRVGTTSTTIGGDGITKFSWRPSPVTLASSLVLTDTSRPGYHLAGVDCTKNGDDLSLPDSRTITLAGLQIGDAVACTFKNQRDTGRITVVKHFDGPPTRVMLQINGTTKAVSDSPDFGTGPVVLPVGTHQVSEEFSTPAIGALYRSAYLCQDADDHTVAAGDGTLVRNGVALDTGDAVTCTFTNSKHLSIQVGKTADPDVVDQPGGEVQFGVTVVNTTDNRATVSKLVDDVFGNLDADAPGTPHWISSSCNTGAVLAPYDGAVGGADTYTCSFTALILGSPGDPHRDTVTAALTDENGDTVEKDATATVNIRGLAPEIEVTKSADPTVVQGSGPVTYTAVVMNASKVDPLRIDRLSDSIYGDLADGHTQATCRYGGDVVQLPFSLPDGESMLCTFEVVVSSSQIDTITASGVDPQGVRATDSDNALVTVTPAPPVPPPPAPLPPPVPNPPPVEAADAPDIGLAVSKIAPARAFSAAEGLAPLTYDIRVGNDGTDTAPHTTLRDPAPTGVRFLRIVHPPSQGGCSITSAGKLLTCALGDIVPGQSIAVRIAAGVATTSHPITSTNVASAACTPTPASACAASARASTRIVPPLTAPARETKPPSRPPPAFTG